MDVKNIYFHNLMETVAICLGELGDDLQICNSFFIHNCILHHNISCGPDSPNLQEISNNVSAQLDTFKWTKYMFLVVNIVNIWSYCKSDHGNQMLQPVKMGMLLWP